MKYLTLLRCSARLKCVLLEMLFTGMLTVLVSAAVLYVFGNAGMDIFELSAGVCVWVSIARLVIAIQKYPHESNAETDTGLESTEQVCMRNFRSIHEMFMCVISMAVILIIIFISWCIHYGIEVFIGFKFWIDFVSS